MKRFTRQERDAQKRYDRMVEDRDVRLAKAEERILASKTGPAPWTPGEFDYYARAAMEALIAKWPIPLFHGDSKKLIGLISRGACHYAASIIAEKARTLNPVPKPAYSEGMALAK